MAYIQKFDDHSVWDSFRHCDISPTGQLTDTISNLFRGRQGRFLFKLKLTYC